MDSNRKAAIAWAKQNEKRIESLSLELHNVYLWPEQRARISETIDALAFEAKQMRAYAFSKGV